MLYVCGTGVDSTQINILDLNSKETRYKHIVYRNLYHCLFTIDNRFLIHADQHTGKNGNIIKFELETFKETGLGSHPAHVQDLKISPDGKYAATAAHDSTAKVWDIEQGKLVRSIIHTNNVPYVKTVCFSRDSKFLVSGINAWNNWHTKIFNISSGEVIYTYPPPNLGLVHGLDVSNNNQFICGGAGYYGLVLLNAKWGETPVLENITNNKPDTKTIPTPFSETVKIEFNLPKAGIVRAFISNEAGESVYVFPEKFFTEGKNTLEWKPNNMPQGVYFCNIRCGEVSLNVKLLLQN